MVSKLRKDFDEGRERFKAYTKKIDVEVKERYERLRHSRKMKALVLLIVVGVLFLVPAYFDVFNPEIIRDVVLEFGFFGPVIFSLIYLVFLFIPFGSTVTTVAAGLIYGPLSGGLFILFLSVTLSVIPFLVARKLGRGWVERKVKEVNIDKYLEKINDNSFWIFFYLRLIPSVPYEFQNYIAGLTNISVKRFMLATLLGIFPIILILTYLGNSLTDIGGQEFWLAVILFLSFLILPPVIWFVYNWVKKRRIKRKI